VILGFRCTDTQGLFETGKSRRFSRILRVATRKLAQLDNATELRDIASPPGNRLEALHGDRSGQHSIRINDQFRLCFIWTQQGPTNVEIVDYHWGAVSVTKNGMRPVHPGEILREDFLAEMGMSANALAKALHVPAPRVNDIVRERRGVSADTALRLARYFGSTPQFWLNLQSAYDLRCAEIAAGRRIAREVSAITDAA
jgi:addiction module HigA family antidote